MSDLIRRSDLMKKCSCRKNCTECDFYTDGDTWCGGEVFGTTIMQMPTIDAVEVVRCCKCEAWEHKTGISGACKRFSFKDYTNWTSENDFCSYGKRKDDNE